MRSFLGAYDAAGLSAPDLGIADVTKTVMAQFYGRLEHELRLGLKHGYDVAVSDFDYDPTTLSVNAKIMPVQPGAAPPPGRKWTVYQTSRGLP